MALSPDRLTVAIYNMSHGIDIWDIAKGERRQSCKMPRSGRNFPLPVAFLHNGGAVIAGHMEGQVGLWDVKDGGLIEELTHPGGSLLSTCSTNIALATDPCATTNLTCRGGSTCNLRKPYNTCLGFIYLTFPPVLSLSQSRR